MAQDQEQRGMMPPLKNIQYINTPVSFSARDEAGAREVSFVVGAFEQHSYALIKEAQVAVAQALIAEMDNDEKRELMDVLAPGIEVAAKVPEGLKKDA